MVWEIAARAGNSVHVLQTVYAHCVDGHSEIVSQQIEHALCPQDPSLPVTASGSPDRRFHRGPVRYMSVNGPQPAARRTASRSQATAGCIRGCLHYG